MTDFYRLADEVDDEASFIAFVAALGRDWEEAQQKEALHPSSPYGPNRNGWENGTIDSFLDAASAWAQASTNLPGYERPENPWRRAAQILHAGKFYE